MQHEPYKASPEQTRTAALKEKLEPIKDSMLSARDTVTEKTCGLCDCATDGIRKNPVAAVVGAAVFGAAVCYLILEGRREATFRERYLSGPLADASDSVSSSLRSTYDNLKFW